MRPGIKLRSIPPLSGSIICLLLCAQVAAAQPSWSIKGAGTSAQLITKILTAGEIDVSSLGPTSLEPADGPMPEIARQEINLKSDDISALTSVKNGCEKLGLPAPDKETTAVEPDLVCIGRLDGESVSVYAQQSCSDHCKLTIETRTIGF